MVDDLAAEYGEVRSEEQLDWPKLQAYLREHEQACRHVEHAPGHRCAENIESAGRRMRD